MNKLIKISGILILITLLSINFYKTEIKAKIKSNTSSDSIFVGTSGGEKRYRVYKRFVEGGIIYEYHIKASSVNVRAEGFRLIFIPNNQIVNRNN